MSFASARAAVARLLRKNGTQIPISYQPPATGVDLATNTETTPAAITGIVTAVILDGPRSPNLTFEQANMIRQNVRTLYVDGATLPAGMTEIEPDTAFTFLGATWRAQGADMLAPDGSGGIMHTVIVKR